MISSSKVAIENGFKADNIMKKLTIELGGRGGGKETLAQGSISKTSEIKETLDSLNRILESF